MSSSGHPDCSCKAVRPRFEINDHLHAGVSGCFCSWVAEHIRLLSKEQAARVQGSLYFQRCSARATRVLAQAGPHENDKASFLALSALAASHNPP